MERNEVRGFTFYPSYYSAFKILKGKEKKFMFINAVLEYIYEDIEPQFDSGKEYDLLLAWNGVFPSLRKSKSLGKNGSFKKPKLTESLKGNSNAKKQIKNESNSNQMPSRIKNKEVEEEIEREECISISHNRFPY